MFCDEHEPTYRCANELRQTDISQLTPQSLYTDDLLAKIGALNYLQLLKCELLVLVLPCGRSAHLEAGWMCGQQRPVYVIGPMVPGEFDAMYVMTNGIFADDQYPQMIQKIEDDWQKIQQEMRT